jgi:hypothetical protein
MGDGAMGGRNERRKGRGFEGEDVYFENVWKFSALRDAETPDSRLLAKVPARSSRGSVDGKVPTLEKVRVLFRAR